MNLNEIYLTSFWGIAFIIIVVIAQGLIAGMAKGSQKGAIPGKLDPALGHESFVFRSNRTFMNTLENLPAMLGTCFLAILIGANAYWTAVFIWAFLGARVIHMILYYVIATNKNPSPRSYFFMLGLFANIALLVLCLKTLFSH